MTVKQLKERLRDFADDAPVMVLNTKTGSPENAETPHATDTDGKLIAPFEPEGWH